MKKGRPWTVEELARIKTLVKQNVSLVRASVILKRPTASIQLQARKLGTPFPGARATKAALRDSIAAAEAEARRVATSD
jgi:transposase-like protein